MSKNVLSTVLGVAALFVAAAAGAVDSALVTAVDFTSATTDVQAIGAKWAGVLVVVAGIYIVLRMITRR